MLKHNIVFLLLLLSSLGLILGTIPSLSLSCLVALVIVLSATFLIIYLLFDCRLFLIFALSLIIILPSAFYAFSFTKNILIQNGYQELTLKIKKIELRERSLFITALSHSHKGQIFYIYTDSSNFFSPYDEIQIKGEAQVFNSGGAIFYFPEISLFKSNRQHPIAKLITWRQSLTRSFNQVLPPTEAALLSGLTFGEKEGFTKDFKDNMQKSGTTHIVALSGQNITILVVIFGSVFYLLFPRILALIFTSSAITLFVLMVGADPSVVRAGLMGFLVLLALNTGRLYSIRNALVLTAWLMLVISPSSFFDPGFELSFMALIGIVYLYPWLTKKIGLDDNLPWWQWRGHLSTTIAAQIAVFPIILLHFGSVSLWSIPANLLIVALVPYLMVSGLILTFLLFIGNSMMPLIEVIAWLLIPFLKWEIGWINFFGASAPDLSVHISSSSFALICLYYLFFFFFIYHLNSHHY